MAVANPDPLIAQAIKDWKRCDEAEGPQRTRTLLAKQFRALDQWPEALKLSRAGAGSIAGQPPQPPRPCLVVDRLSQPVRQISNTIKNADFGFDVMPNGGGADIATAEILKGYLRRVQNQARGESPIEWAADGAVEGGFGWFRLACEYVHNVWTGDPSDPEAFDQEIRMYRLPNNLAVYCDPSANKPTRRDAQVMFVVEDLDRETAKKRYDLTDDDMRSLDQFQSKGDCKGWVSKDTMRVAEYWRVEYETKEITATDGRKRTLRTPKVKGSLINAVKVLENFDSPWSRIPIFPILGEELNIDGKTILRGVIELGMDAQRMVNYTYSGAIENVALSSKNAPRVPAESIARYKAIWETRNIFNYGFLPYDPFDAQGRPMPPPQDDTTEPPIQALVQMMRTSEDAIKASTSTGDASLGNTNPNERSGRALEALQAQSDLANSNYVDHVKRALIDAAEEMIHVIPKITRPGQIIHILGMDDEPEQVMVGQPFVAGPDGIPQPAPETVTPEIAKQKDNLYKFYDVTRGRYAVTATVGKASATRQQEGSKALGELIPHLPPEMAAAVTPDYVKQLSFPGAQGIAEKLEKTLPPHLQPQKEGEAQALPPEVQAQMQQMQGALQEAQQAIATDQAKQQSAVQIAEMKEAGEMERERMRIAADMQKAEMQHAASITVARINAEAKTATVRVQAEEERLATGLDLAASLESQERQQTHDVGMAAMGHAVSTDAAESGRAHESAEAEAARTAAAEQSEADRIAARAAQEGKETV